MLSKKIENKLSIPRNTYFILFLLFISLALISNYIWLKKDNSVQGCDSSRHLLFSVEFFYGFSDIIHSSISWGKKIIDIIKLMGTRVWRRSVYWPNGLNLTASVMYSIFEKSLFSAKLSLLPYLFILLFSTYLIGKLIFSDCVGLLASFILFMYPIIFESSRQFQLDFPLTAMVALNILFLIKCNNFKVRKYSLFLGLSLGWSMLVKGQTILFIIWPLLWVLYLTFRNFKRETFGSPLKSKQLQNIIISITVASLIASVWWGHQLRVAIKSLEEHIFIPGKALESIYPWNQKYSLDSILFHLRELFHSSLGPFLFVAFIISFLFSLRQKIKYKGIFLSWLIIPFLLFSLVFTIKEPRFLMPVLPVMALITAWGLYQIKTKNLRISILLILILFSIIKFYIFSYCDYKYRFISIGPLSIFASENHIYGYEVSPFDRDRRDLKIDEVVSIIKAHQPFGQLVKIGSINCGGELGPMEMTYWLKMKDRFLHILSLTETHRKFLENFNDLDFILISLPSDSSLQWPGGEEFRVLLRKYSQKIISLEAEDPIKWEQLVKTLENSKSDFQLIGRIPQDERFVYYIYKRIQGKR